MDNERVAGLYRKHGPAIYLRCLRLLRDEAAAEDAVQETFLRVHRHLDWAPEGDQIFAWIYRVATNLCLTLLRDRKPTAELSELASTCGSVDDFLANRELVTLVISRIPEKYALPAWLHYLDDIDQGEVARILGVTRRTVINRLAVFLKAARRYTGRRS